MVIPPRLPIAANSSLFDALEASRRRRDPVVFWALPNVAAMINGNWTRRSSAYLQQMNLRTDDLPPPRGAARHLLNPNSNAFRHSAIDSSWSSVNGL